MSATDTFTVWVIELAQLEVTYDQDTRTSVSCEPLQRVQMGEGNSADEIRQFYLELLKLPWLPVGLRNAVMREADLSPRKRRQDYEAGRTAALQLEVDERKARMKVAKARPRGGIHDAAVAAAADAHGLSIEALKQRVTRLRKRHQKQGDTK